MRYEPARDPSDRISVVIPTFEGEPYLTEAVDSILDQTHDDYDVWLVTDGEQSDATRETCYRYHEESDCIHVLDGDVRLGPGPAREEAIDRSSAEYISLLDSDDVAHSDMLEQEVAALDDGADLVGDARFCCEYLDADGTQLNHAHDRLPNWSVEQIVTDDFFHTSTLAYPNTDAVSFRPKLKLLEEFDLQLQILTEVGRDVRRVRAAAIRKVPDSVSRTQSSSGKYHRKVKEFYRERVETGTDSYDEWGGFEDDLGWSVQ